MASWSAATWTGWLAALAIVVAATIPLATRFRLGKRGAPGSPPIRAHVLLGLVTSYTMGGLIHILLVVAIIVVLVRVIQGRKPL